MPKPCPWLLPGLAGWSIALAATAQSAPDPHTNNEPAALARAGYRSLGPFAFGTGHDSADIAALLPEEQLLWIETAHFRIGCALPACEVPRDRVWRARLRSELAALDTKLSGVDRSAARLERWPRAHLIAQRLERLYADVQTVLRCDDDDFAEAPGDDREAQQADRGEGPFLGQRRPFTVLLLERAASIADYTAAYHGRATTCPKRFLDLQFGTAFVGVAAQSEGGLLLDDETLAAHLTYHVAWQLYSSYRGNEHPLPPWLVNGLAHRHARQASERRPIYFDPYDADAARRYADWGRSGSSQRRRAEGGSLAELMQKVDVEAFSEQEHLQSWAVVDQLVRRQPEALARLMRLLGQPFAATDRFPTVPELHARQATALRLSFGVDPGDIDKNAWWRTPR